MRVEQHFHVGDIEAQPGDAPNDQRGAFGIAAVDQYVAVGPGEQEGGHASGADVVEIASDAEWLIGNRTVSRDRRAPGHPEHHHESGCRSEQYDQPPSLDELRHPPLAPVLIRGSKYLALQSGTPLYEGRATPLKRCRLPIPTNPGSGEPSVQRRLLATSMSYRIRPRFIVSRSWPKVRMSIRASPSITTTSASSPGARRPVRLVHPNLEAGAMVRLARIA